MLNFVKITFSVLLLSAAPSFADEVFSGRVTVIDGDTIDVGTTRVRLHGIDAPESWQQCQTEFGTGFDCGDVATEYLAAMAEGKRARCERTDYDAKHGRVVARCYVRGVDIARQMVLDGYALAYRKYSMDYDLEEKQAVVNDHGLHASRMQDPAWVRQTRAKGRIPPDPDCRIKGNISASGSRIFHSPGQKDYERTGISPDRGERWFCNPSEALAAGWRAAKR